MLVYEMNDVDLSWDIKILASDANVCSLKIAYSGEYNAEQVDRVPPDYLVKYFSRKKINGKEIFQIKNTLKEKLIFRRLNLMVSIKRLAGPIDLIFCRNVLIYFDFTAKKEIINQFYDLLEPKGYLCLGTSESLLGIDDRFYQKGRAIYQKK
jgi:chemotaxis protein methyltransferase CheR